jgi:hypothetical protein
VASFGTDSSNCCNVDLIIRRVISKESQTGCWNKVIKAL